MIINIDDNKTKEILKISSPDIQLIKWLEELAELAKELAKGRREGVTIEAADVCVCLAQIFEHYGIDTRIVEEIATYKQNRTINRLTGSIVIDGNELKQCPFCKSEAKVMMFPYHNSVTYSVECTKCGHDTMEHNTREEAVDAWNGRP